MYFCGQEVLGQRFYPPPISNKTDDNELFTHMQELFNYSSTLPMPRYKNTSPFQEILQSQVCTHATNGAWTFL